MIDGYNFGGCPYCGSNDTTSGSYLYSVHGTRQPAFKCKDCGHTFSFSTYSRKRTEEIRVNEMLSSLLAYEFIEQRFEGFFRITAKGRAAIKAQKKGEREYTACLDDLLLKTPLWKDLSKELPMHPTKEMFFKVLSGLEGLDIQKSKRDILWYRYNSEVIPALERKQRRHGITGLHGITLTAIRKKEIAL